jgi:hypothetical protein
MPLEKIPVPENEQLAAFLKGKSAHTILLFNYFIEQFKTIGDITFIPPRP